ncbi:MAG: VWA domain-containing protein, partial [Alphaproteobacteria bacterium]|nr:VWA domain-containing protein [Alphaproteobacteria bacterium]
SGGGGEGSDSEDEKDGKGGEESDSEDGKDSGDKEDEEKTIKDLVEEYKDKEDNEKNAEDAKKNTMQRRLDSAKSSDGKGGGGAGSASSGIKNLPLGDWSDYQTMAKQFKPASNRLARIFDKVREHQLRTVKSISKNKTLIPEDGEFSRFSSSAQMDLNKKKATGRQLEEKDFRLFKEDNEKTKTSKVDLVVWIDGSGSMSGDPLKRAIQAGCLLLEATKEDKDVNTYVGIWGHDDPIILASPGDTAKEIGEKIQGAQNGLGSATYMAPAVKKTAEIIASRKINQNEQIGNTHMLFISDGDIHDPDNTKEMIKTLFKNTKDITLDVAITSNGYRSGDGSEMQQIIEDTAKEIPGSSVGVSKGNTPDELLNCFMDSLLKRIRANKSMVSKPASSKQKAMQKALDEMKKGR